MAWALVFFDLPAGTPEAHKVTTNLRKDLFKNGHMMIQFSMYGPAQQPRQPCGNLAASAQTKVPRPGLSAQTNCLRRAMGPDVADAQPAEGRQ